MDPELHAQAFHRSLEKATKWALFLLLIKANKPLEWTAFLSANPWVRALLNRYFHNNNNKASQRRLNKLSNAVSVAFLYGATSSNRNIPKDYVSLYLCERYFGSLNPPSSALIVSPSSAKYFKLDSYPPWVRRLYGCKHYVIFPLIYAQILSNYLTPTRYKLNQRYLSSSLKTYLLDPIWINFRMGVNFQSVSWPGLLSAYIKHNAYLGVYFLLANLAPSVIGGWREGADIKAEVFQYLKKSAHKANSIANFLYKPSLLSMLILSLTAPMLTRIPAIHKLYVSNMKNITKNYIKAVAFLAAFVTISTQNFPLVFNTQQKEVAETRKLSVSFYNGINMYFLRIIVLSKWRILKENHPWFTILKVGTWQRIEAASMCFLVWKLMNLQDYVSNNSNGHLKHRCQQLQSDRLMRVMKRIVH